MKKWLRTICEILEHPRHKQVYGRLIIFRSLKSRKIEGKCVLGEIGCQLGFTPNELFNMNTLDYIKILRKAQVPKWLLEGLNLPHFSMGFHEWYGWGDNLDSWLYELNDNHLTYEEISDFLKTTFEDA